MYQAIDGLEMREVGTETLIYDSAREKVHVVNHTAADLLKRCSGKSLPELTEYVRSAYDSAGYDVEKDLNEILDVFQAHGLVQKISV